MMAATVLWLWPFAVDVVGTETVLPKPIDSHGYFGE